MSVAVRDNVALLLPANVDILVVDATFGGAGAQSRCRSYLCYSFPLLGDVMLCFFVVTCIIVIAVHLNDVPLQ
jgi:hypothetical protein